MSRMSAIGGFIGGLISIGAFEFTAFSAREMINSGKYGDAFYLGMNCLLLLASFIIFARR